jgi:hypothetical protein
LVVFCTFLYGTHWITNGTINKKIKKEDKIPNKFWLGRT